MKKKGKTWLRRHEDEEEEEEDREQGQAQVEDVCKLMEKNEGGRKTDDDKGKEIRRGEEAGVASYVITKFPVTLLRDAGYDLRLYTYLSTVCRFCSSE